MDNTEQLELLPTSIDSNKVVLKFETTEHQIDATLVANTLLAFDKTIKGFAECEKLSGTTVDVENIKSGCIEIGAIISVVQTLNNSAGYIIALWNHLKELYSLYKFLQGQPPADTKKEKDKVHVENHIGEKAVFNNCTFQQYICNGSTILGNGENILKDPNIAEFKVLDENRNTVLQVPRSEFANFVPYKNTPKHKSDQVLEEISELTIETVPLRNPQKTWKFIGEDGSRVSAKIKDDDFINRIRSGYVAFVQGDKMKCRLETKKRFDVALNTFVIDKKIIKEVIQYTPRVHTVAPDLPGV